MRITVTTSPVAAAYEAFYPLAMAKEALKVRHTVEDTLIRQMADAAITICENAARVSMLEKTVQVRLTAPTFECDELGIIYRTFDPDKAGKGIRLPHGPVTSIVSVSHVTQDNVATVFGVELYRLDPGAWLKWNGKLASFDKGGEIVVNFMAGISPDDVTKHAEISALRLAIGEVLTVMYENRGMSEAALSATARRLLARFWTTYNYH